MKENSNIPVKDKAGIQRLINEAVENYIKTFKEQVYEIMPFAELSKNVYQPIYKKHFTLSEIKEITKFYESHVGKKFVALTPAIMKEANMMVNEKYGNQILKMSRDIALKEQNRLQQEVIRLGDKKR